MTSRIYEEQGFEDAIEAHLVEHGGYERLDRSEFDAERGFFPDVVVDFVRETQPETWEAIEAAYQDKARRRFLRELEGALDRQSPLHLLRHGFRIAGETVRLAFFEPVSGLNPQIREKYEANRLTLTRQFPYNPDSGETIDLCLALNGLPVVTAELKNPMTDQTVDHAQQQYKEDRDPEAPAVAFLRGAMAHFALDPHQAYYTTRLEGSETSFLPFNKGRGNGAGNPEHPSGHRTAYLWEEVWAKDSLMDIVQRFLHVETEEIREGGRVVDEKRTMIWPRYHQLECVRQLLDTTQDEGPGHNYLVQHSTGSGKSKSIGWLAHRLVSLHDEFDETVFDSVVVVTDRTVLDNQLQDTIYQIEQKSGIVHGIEGDGRSKSEELAEKLEQGKPIIVVTLQTFPHVIEHISQLSERDYAVVVDEAHSSQTGEMAKEMKQILSGIDLEGEDDWETLLAKSAQARGRQDNLSFFAFTATPKGKTLEVFGRTPEDGDTPVPFHVYSMRQAIEEGFILDVLQNYTTYDTYVQLAKSAEDDPELPTKKASKALKTYLKLHEYNIAQKVEVIVEHFRDNVMDKIGGRARAMVVTDSRKAAVRYKLKVDAYLDEHGYDDMQALVAFSGTVEDEGAEYTEPRMNEGIKESELPDKFHAKREYRLLIVAEKYQTGFDEPLLHTMYVDKALSGVQAVQTLSRLNRTHPGKQDTFVLDFVNDEEDILDAFQDFYEYTTTEGRSDPQHVYQLEQELKAFQLFTDQEVEEFCKVFFDPEISTAETAHPKLYQWTEPGLDRFQGAEEEIQEEFRGKLRAFLNLYKFQSQVVDYEDTELEKLYTFGRFLYPQLPTPSQGPQIEFDDEVALEYYRMEKVHEGSLEPEEDREGRVQPPSQTGTGSAEDDESPLSEIIERINESLGARDFTKADRLLIEQVGEAAKDDEQLQKAAKVNTKEQFSHVLEDRAEEIFFDRMDQNEELFKAYLDDPDVQRAIAKYWLDTVYEELQD